MTGHIYVYGEIGTATGQVSTKYVKEQIDRSATDYILHIFSPGGDVFEGYGIYNALKNDIAGKPLVAHIEGLCASIATLIVAAAPTIIMNRTGQFMIHNPHITDLKGDANMLRNVADQLDQIKSLLIDVYKKRTGLSEEKLWALYDNETYMTADEAMKMGFIDESVDAIKAVARVDQTKFKMETKPSFIAQIKKLFTATKFEKFKNDFTETLDDGTAIVVQSEDDNWTGKPVFREDGTPLEAGTYTLQSGKSIVVDATGMITEVNAAQAPADNMENEKIKELEAQLAEARAALAEAQGKTTEAENKTVTAEAKATKFENKLTALESDFLKMKEQMTATFGQKKGPDKGPTIKNLNPEDQYDPMGEDALKEFKRRNLI